MAKARAKKAGTVKHKTMSKYEKQGQSKIINSYGAVGTLIQTMNNGSLMIENFDQWPYYRMRLPALHENNTSSAFIEEPRLIKRLVDDLGCAGVLRIFKMPENKSTFIGVENENNVISARFFPEWFYCPKCGKMNYFSRLLNDENPQFPRCDNSLMEQFSFILISDSGKIADIPWIEFLQAGAADIDIQFGIMDAVNRALDVNFKTGGSAEHLETKKVTATVGGVNITKSLATLPAKNFIDQNNNHYKMAIRQGNNICFVKTLASVYIPEYTIPPNEITILKNTVRNFVRYNAEVNAQTILDDIIEEHPHTETTLNHINEHLAETAIIDGNPLLRDEKYKWKEFDFITNRDAFNEKTLAFNKFRFGQLGIEQLYRISTLKVTQVQTGYTRLKPEGTVSKIYTNPNIQFYPGVEMFGEGILIKMDTAQLNGFFNAIHQVDAIFAITNINALIHSLSHCIMKELEFECGYPLNSLKERLYFGTEDVHDGTQVNYAGVLIYSASGANSSFGGIAALFEGMKIEQLIKNAIVRAKDCPNDPICESETSNGNEGVCYSCNLIPETSCENFNTGLNRKVLNEFYNFLNE